MAAKVKLEELEIQPVDHYGLVVSLIEKFGLTKRLDNRLPRSKEKGSIAMHGQRIKAMIVTGLGFGANPLYLSPQFSEGKSVSRLIGEGVEAEHLNDDVLGANTNVLYRHKSGKSLHVCCLKNSERNTTIY